ncbi:MAG: hypothetical protein K8L97_08095 [Anaerolineae bacterium]|nr:hypothetical protein [Anaerolineae bacterium]
MQKLIQPVLFLLSLLLLLASVSTPVALAQSVESRIAYVQRLPDMKRISVYGTPVHIDTILNSCLSFSPSLHYLSVMHVNNSIPYALKVYDLDTGNLLLDLPWSNTWESRGCPVEWESETDLSILNPATGDPPTQTKITINVLTGVESGPTPYIYLPMLTNRDPDSKIIRPSPDGSHYVYVRCNEPYSFPNGCPGAREVIYDVTTQQVITKLEDTPITPLNAAFPEYQFSWSPSGRYLAYPLGLTGLNVFDLQTQAYLDTDFLDQGDLLIDNTKFGMKWSPDETRLIIFGELINSTTYDTTVAVSLIDLQTHSITSLPIDETETPFFTEQFAWLPDNQHLLVAREDSQLVRIDANALDEPGEVVASDIESIYSWYLPSTESSTETPTPTVLATNTDTPTELPTATNTPTENTPSYCAFGGDTPCNVAPPNANALQGTYTLRARAQNTAGTWSEWVTRTFVIGIPSQYFLLSSTHS